MEWNVKRIIAFIDKSQVIMKIMIHHWVSGMRIPLLGRTISVYPGAKYTTSSWRFDTSMPHGGRVIDTSPSDVIPAQYAGAGCVKVALSPNG
jgi:hypothetical protein